MLFSERFGILSAREAVQINDMDEALRNRLWSVTYNHFFNDDTKMPMSRGLLEIVWSHFLKKPVDDLPSYFQQINVIKELFMENHWYKVYDLIEFIIQLYDAKMSREAHMSEYVGLINYICEQEMSAYRLVNDSFVRITSEREIEAIDKAVDSSQGIVHGHLNNALHLLSDREGRHYRNSIKESISAVEGLCQQILGEKSTTLGQALDRIEKNDVIHFHGSLKEGFKKIYGYTSDADGIRHAMVDGDHVAYEDAQFMLVACSAFINYLSRKCDEAGIVLK